MFDVAVGNSVAKANDHVRGSPAVDGPQLTPNANDSQFHYQARTRLKLTAKYRF
jgi:hypothetical protein